MPTGLHYVNNRGTFGERMRKRKIEREQQITNIIEIDTYLFVKWNDQIKLGRFRQRALPKKWDKKASIKIFVLHHYIYSTKIGS